jgi:hypothetical protein
MVQRFHGSNLRELSSRKDSTADYEPGMIKKIVATWGFPTGK